MEDEVEGDDDSPSATDAIEIPVDLFREVAGPDDKELAECEVDVEHDEGEGELAEIVLLRRAKNRAEGLSLGKADGGHDGEREHRVSLADQEEEAIDGGEPGDVHGHDPV